AALAAARRPGEALRRVADRACRLHAGPLRRAGRPLDQPRPRDRRSRRRTRARRRRVRAARADRRRRSLRRPPDARARLLGRGGAVSAMRILIVEDDERLAEIFRDFVAELGYQPIVVGSAEAAPERRPAARAAVKLGVRIAASNGTLDGTCVEISSTGMKVRVSRRLRAGQAAKLEFTPPDGGAPIDVLALVVRVDADGAAFWFL